jgi:hypothetical protein
VTARVTARVSRLFTVMGMAYHFPDSFLLLGSFLSANLYFAMIVGFCGNGGLALKGESVCDGVRGRPFLVYK